MLRTRTYSRTPHTAYNCTCYCLVFESSYWPNSAATYTRPFSPSLIRDIGTQLADQSLNPWARHSTFNQLVVYARRQVCKLALHLALNFLRTASYCPTGSVDAAQVLTYVQQHFLNCICTARPMSSFNSWSGSHTHQMLATARIIDLSGR